MPSSFSNFFLCNYAKLIIFQFKCLLNVWKNYSKWKLTITLKLLLKSFLIVHNRKKCFNLAWYIASWSLQGMQIELAFLIWLQWSKVLLVYYKYTRKRQRLATGYMVKFGVRKNVYVKRLHVYKYTLKNPPFCFGS